jgi:hypothetical protein
LGKDEEESATRAALHANTPSRDWLDTLGRIFLSREHNRCARDGEQREEFLFARSELDIVIVSAQKKESASLC